MFESATTGDSTPTRDRAGQHAPGQAGAQGQVHYVLGFFKKVGRVVEQVDERRDETDEGGEHHHVGTLLLPSDAVNTVQFERSVVT